LCSLCVPFVFSCPLPLMPRDFLTLSDMPQSLLGIECALCQRREQFDVEALKAQHGGDVKMPEFGVRQEEPLRAPLRRGWGRLGRARDEVRSLNHLLHSALALTHAPMNAARAKRNGAA
jgi:hypothetical protein